MLWEGTMTDNPWQTILGHDKPKTQQKLGTTKCQTWQTLTATNIGHNRPKTQQTLYTMIFSWFIVKYFSLTLKEFFIHTKTICALSNWV